MKIEKFVNTRDGGEVDDDDIFLAEVSLAEGKLELLVIGRENLSGKIEQAVLVSFLSLTCLRTFLHYFLILRRRLENVEKKLQSQGITCEKARQRFV
jgi:hypothetical protein